ncbi:MAG: sensor histidine kinase, partial [Bacteroidota bacterium]
LNSYKYLGEAYLALKNYTRAIQYLGEGYDIIRETGNQGLKLEFYSYLSRAHAGQEDYRKAFLFSEQRNTLNDTLYQISKAEAEEEMETRFETKLKENKIALQEAKIQEAQNRSRLYLIISCLLGLFVIAAIIFTYFLRRSRKELAEKNKLISKSLEEKEMLLKEIHHRVKNNLQVISSLLNLQSQTVKDASAQSAIIEGRNRVKSMALIHQNLYQEQDMRGVDAAEYVTKLTENLFDSYQVDHENIRFQHRVSPLTLDVDTVIPIGLILNELISNALKYAFPEGRPGILEVRLEESQEGLKLSVLDDGVGVEPEVFNHQSNSMGYRIIRAFVKKLKAIMTVNHENGTRIDILIPQ